MECYKKFVHFHKDSKLFVHNLWTAYLLRFFVKIVNTINMSTLLLVINF